MRNIIGQVEEWGQFNAVEVNAGTDDATTYRTNLRRRGFWVGDRQVLGTAQRSFASDAAFRRFAAQYHRAEG